MKKVSFQIGALVSLVAFSILGCSGGRPPSEEEPALQIGSEAPSFRLRDLGGAEVSLDQYRGKIVMLDFWATWCGPCRISMPILEDLQKEFPNDMSILAINMQESRPDVAGFVEKRRLRARVLLDEQGRVAETYGASSIPMQVIIDRNGIIRHVQVGVGPHMASQLRTEISKLR